MQEFVALANKLADAAGEILRLHFRTPFEIISKDDASPVTIADRAIEQALRHIIERERPNDGILGEEFGTKPSKNGYVWVIDPIDGTKSFVIGRPTFGTLIALCENDIPLLGVIDQAISKERWIGVRDAATLYNGTAVKTRPCKSLAEACIASTTPAMFKNGPAVYEGFESRGKMMAWGGDCYMYGLLASGFLDICVEDSLSPYDFAALVPIVEGAGGQLTDWQGQKLSLKSGGQVIALGDPSLWDEASALFIQE